VQTLLDRARENSLILIDETRGIISAMETGIRFTGLYENLID
jgi:hypothetical protein